MYDVRNRIDAISIQIIRQCECRGSVTTTKYEEFTNVIFKVFNPTITETRTLQIIITSVLIMFNLCIHLCIQLLQFSFEQIIEQIIRIRLDFNITILHIESHSKDL
ncbi:Hypothetical_protein [Hexamita inflata]|uniref:Hypothetical_protein n=1 Tax=Hexamita inflata TaxID=28002 RepID=A0AA86PI54_9EUKA|nr:Hypothetical protein HINF_LOCUS27737 [Hexamita inflata]CAI9940095.1 Hypothetical protein HINF_LOCUS27740 [Hexamita inflata]